jgi:predicted GNAT superfamily acetyltransferase
MNEIPSFSIRELKTYDECVAIHQVQHACWGFDSDEGLYPPMLLTAAQNGGVLLGAFNDQGEMIGYLFGYLGRAPGGPLKLCSQTMGVLPAYRNAGVATALKLAQRKHVIAQGLPLITWTYDPLEAASARLNLHKLGATARTLKRNVYGKHFGQLNEGLPTDRFLVEWWLESEHVVQQLIGERYARQARPVTRVSERDGLQQLDNYDLTCDDESVWVEIPRNLQALKRASLASARDWRAKTRLIFEHYFERGYVAIDFVSERKSQPRRRGYVLRRGVQVPGA